MERIIGCVCNFLEREGDGQKMTALQNFFSMASRMQWTDYLDIVVVTFLIYKLLPMLRSSGTMRIAKTVGVLLLVSWVTEALGLHTLNYLMDQVLAVGLIAVVVLFQPELLLLQPLLLLLLLLLLLPELLPLL